MTNLEKIPLDANSIEFTKESFERVVLENIKLNKELTSSYNRQLLLERQRTKDLEEISRKTDKIITLQADLIFIESGGEIELREKVQVLQRKVSHYQDQYLDAIGEPKVLDNISAKVLKVVH
jgi:hypothetical protein